MKDKTLKQNVESTTPVTDDVKDIAAEEAVSADNIQESIVEEKAVSEDNDQKKATLVDLANERIIFLEQRVQDLENENSELKIQLDQTFSPVLTEFKNPVTVVIPFAADLSQGNELQLAVRSWDKYFREDFNLVIIGDRQEWMNDLVDVIEHKRVGNNPPLDIAQKMLLAIESDLVTEKFIWSNDDQYLISPCMMADFETLKCTGRLGEKEFGSNLYQRNKARTKELLIKEGIKEPWDFSTHMPFVFEKDKLEKIIENYNLTEEALLIATFYYNMWFQNFIPYQIDTQVALNNDNLKIGVYRQNADLNRLKELLPKKKLISNSEQGWTAKLAEILNKLFPEKCKFEN